MTGLHLDQRMHAYHRVISPYTQTQTLFGHPCRSPPFNQGQISDSKAMNSFITVGPIPEHCLGVKKLQKSWHWKPEPNKLS